MYKVALFLVGAVLAAQPRLGFVRTIGGAGEDTAKAIARDENGNLFVAGTTTSYGLGTAGAIQPLPASASLFQLPASGMQPVRLPVATDVNSLAVSGSSPTTAAAATTAGLALTNDGGASWRMLLSGQSVQAVAMAPSTDAMLCASILVPPHRAGEPALTDQYCSRDGGANWQKLAPFESDQEVAVQVVRLTINAGSPARIFAFGTRFRGSAVYIEAAPAAHVSQDAGMSWSRLPGWITQVSFDTMRTGTIYALDFDTGALKSTDNGATWQSLPAPNLDWYHSILADPRGSNVVYLSGAVAGVGDGIWKSSDGGASWEKAEAGTGLSLRELRADALGRVYGTTGNLVFRSDDGFQNIERITPWLSSWISEIAVTAAGEVWIGTYYSSDVFVSKLTPQGEIEWITYLGGSQGDSVSAIAVDAYGDIYLTGETQSFDFPFTSPVPEGTNPAYVMKISGDGTRLIYSAALPSGGSPKAITIDSGGYAYIAGSATPLFQATSGAFQTEFQPILRNTFSRNAMVVKLAPDGSWIEFATFLGSDLSSAAAIALDTDGGVLVAGTALWKLASDGTRLEWSTWVDGWNALAVTPLGDGRMLVCGSTRSDKLWTSPDAYQPVAPPYSGPLPPPRAAWPSIHRDAFVLQMGPGADIEWSTLLGGQSSEACLAVWPEEEGKVTAAGITQSADFPVQSGLEGTPARYSGFAARFGMRGTSLVYSTTVPNGQIFTPAAAARHTWGGAVLAGATRRDVPSTEPIPDNDALIVWVAEN